MKRVLINLVLLAVMANSACADFEWPPEQVSVRIDGQPVRAYWKDGKPFVERQAVLPILHIRNGPEELDLGETMQSKGYTMVQQADGSIDCSLAKGTNAGLLPTVPLVIRPANRSAVAPSKAQHQQEWQAQQGKQARQPKLVATSYRYIADTEYIRAFCVVENQGGGPSPSCTAMGEFVDWFGEPFARHSLSLPRLNPGESVEMTFFSMVQKDEQPRKADKYTCRVKFLGSGLAEDGSAAKSNPTKSYRPSAAVKARVRSTDFKVDSSTTKFTRGTPDTRSNATTDANGFPSQAPR